MSDSASRSNDAHPLQEAKQTFASVFNALPGAYLLLTPDLKIEAVSDAYLAATQTARENLVGKHMLNALKEYTHNLESQVLLQLKASLEQVLATASMHEVPRQCYRIPNAQDPKGYTERYLVLRNSPVHAPQGHISHVIHEVINLTENVEAEMNLQQSQAREARANAEVTQKTEALEQMVILDDAKLQELDKQLKHTNKDLKAAVHMAETAEHKVVQERNLLDSLLEQAPVAIGLFQGEDFVVAKANKRLCAMWGYTPEQVIGKPLLVGVPELQGQGFTELMAEVARTRKPFIGTEVPAQLLQSSGLVETHYFNFVYQPLYDKAGDMLGVLDIAIDVTEQVVYRQQVESLNEELESRVARRTQEVQQAQAEAERQRNRLANFFMHAPAAICILSGPDLVFELVNPVYEQLFPGRKLLGKPILEALPEIEHNEVYRTFRKVYETGLTHEEREMLVPLARPEDGVLENRYFKYIQQARHDEQENIDGVLVFAFEVTDQVNARKASEASAKGLKLLTDSLPALISYVDQERKYRFVNGAYKAWFNQDPEQLVNQSVSNIIGQKAYKNVKGYIDRALSGERVDFDATMPYRNNFIKHIHTSYVPDIQQGKTLGFYALVHDVTDQVNAQEAVLQSEQQAKELANNLATANEELSKTNEQLTRINSDLDNFIYTASHDLKAPILNIEGLMGALIDELPSDTLQAPVVQQITMLISNSVDRFKRTIEHLTEIIKLQKQNNAEASQVNLADIVDDVQLDLASNVKVSRADIRVDLGDCPIIDFSAKNLRSIVYNLISNALKYSSPDRTPLIEIKYTDSPDYHVLSVKDNGLGLDQSQQSKLFQMFQRLHSHVDGTGVGLYMVKRIVDNAGGKIEVESALNKGTEFKVYFRKTQ